MGYCTVAEADAWVGSVLGFDAWAEASEATKQKAINSATEVIDRLPLAGERHVATQENEFPRDVRRASDGALVEGTSVPVEVKKACAYEAATLLEQKDNPRLELQRQGVVSASVRGVSESYNGRFGTRSLLSREARELMRGWILGGVPML